MPRLLSHRDFDKGKENPSWWFEDAHYNSSNERYSFDVEKAFPFKRAIHQSLIGKEDYYAVDPKQQALRVAIRRFVERNCSGNVFWQGTGEKMDYQYIWADPESSPRDKYHLVKIEHGYLEFFFEEEVDSTLFKVAFGAHVSPVSNRHPKYFDVTEEQIADARANKHGLHYPDWTCK